MPGNAINKPELFKRLAEGHAAGITVVTPNRRLAQVLRSQFDDFQVGKGLSVWEDADIVPLDSVVGRCHEDALYAEGGELPLLLSPAQSRELWEAAIAGSRWANALLDVPKTTARAADAWKSAQAWRIAGALEKFEGTEDTHAFAEWAKTYARRLKKDGFTDLPLLFDAPFKTKTKLLVAYAFDIVPKQAEEFFSRFEWVSCSPSRKKSIEKKMSFASPKEELETAAAWARARLEEGGKHIGVVVPDLKLRRREVARVFERVMGSPLPFELSAGEPLSDYPLVSIALDVIALSQGEMPFEEASRIIRSPFLAGADGERAARARLDARLRREAGSEISLARLTGLIPGDLILRSLFESIYKRATEKKSRSPHDWARHFTALLDAAGFPGDRSADSAEFQAHARFNEVLAEFARLSVVNPRMSDAQALSILRRLCADTEFQPEGAGAPIQVLGLLESAGIEFDALWVSGLTDGQWPQRVRPDPFLPVPLQRKAGIPEASAEASLALDKRRTESWLGAADEVVFSWARREEDRELSPSPLIAQVPDGTVKLPVFASYRDLIFKAGKIEAFADEKATPLESVAASGGTGVLSDQAACPFRAFAHHRMRARALESPEAGLDALERGNLVHALMAGIWKEVKTQAGLAGELSAVIARAADGAVKELKLEGRFAELEKKRLIRLAQDWLALERDRTPFEVVQTEEEKQVKIGGLTLRGRIDRMDKLADGSYALIDYKTGSQLSPRLWMGERPEEPQLPLYAVTAKEDVSAVAFAKFRTGKMRFMGYARAKDALPKLTHYPSWDGLLAGWKDSLEKLAGDYVNGDARVNPKNGLATCRNCDLQPLCRVHERISALEEEEGEE